MARFARRARLLKAGEFDQAFKRGRRIQASALAAVIVANGLDLPRLGLAIAKKAVPLATRRNLIKRQIRESFRQHTGLPAFDVVIVARPSARSCSATELRHTLQQLWTRIAASSPPP